MNQNVDERIIDSAKEYIRTLFLKNADGHDTAHSLRVHNNALSIYECMKNAGSSCNKGIIALASLLHDVDDHKLFKTENNANARAFLEFHHIDETTIESILSVINGVSFSKNRGQIPATIEGKIVQDADRLDAIGAIGIARTFAYGGSHGRDLRASIGHFHDKLLLLKDEMNTEAAKKLAEERHAYMLSFLEEFKKETENLPMNENVVIETERLLLRKYTPDDFVALYDIVSDPETMQHYPAPFTEERTRGWIAWNLDNYEKYGFGLWAVVLKETGEFIGDCGITIQNIDGEMLPEIGYHIHKKYWKRGFGKEAARACRDWVFTNTTYDTIYSYMKYTNIGSYSTAIANGMKKVKEYPDPKNEISYAYAITREEWEKLKNET